MKQKHIDVVTKYFYPIAAGIETNILETYSILAKKGWDITIHTSKDEYLTKNSLPDAEMIRGLRVIRYPFTSEVSGFTPNIDWKNTSIIALHNFNVFFCKLFIKSLWLKISGKKQFALIVTPHGGFNPKWSMYSFLTKIFKIPYHYLIGTFLINTVVDSIRAVSEWEKQEITKRGVIKNKIVVITNGIENEAYGDIDRQASVSIKQKVKKLGSYIVQMGRIYPIKNYETTIRALVHAPRNINYVIVGEEEEKNTSYKTSLIQLARTLGVEDRVIFLGVLRGIDKYYVLKHASMMVHMALWESFCNVVHEGMSQGLVCIVANNTALPLLIKNDVNGYCVDTYNYIALAEKINYVLANQNSTIINAMKIRNKKLCQDTSWKNVAESMNTLYNSLIRI